MHIGKSIRMALIKRNRDIDWLAEKMGCSRSNADRMRYSKILGGSTIERLATIFDMKVSEFIELGED